jgi:hypothetical protein
MADWQDGFLKYDKTYVRKVNAQRIAQSRPDLCGVPILDGAGVLFSSASEAHDEPRSCYNCPFFNYDRSCKLLPASIVVKKITIPLKAEANSKPIEYWPVCGYWVYGHPNYGPEEFVAKLDPDSAGLGWVNAPEPGLDKSGTSCGGAHGGDDCDLWMTDEPDKRGVKQGFCRVLQADTGNMDCCSAWQDDDFLTWQMVQERFKERG